MKKNVKQKAEFRWKCVLKSMFILLFTRINNEQSSIISKISIYLPNIRNIFLKHLPTLHASDRMKDAFPEPQLVAYRRDANLEDI